MKYRTILFCAPYALLYDLAKFKISDSRATARKKSTVWQFMICLLRSMTS